MKDENNTNAHQHFEHMLERLNERITVVAVYDKNRNIVMPWRITWNGRRYYIKKIGYHHKVKRGAVFHHIFSVCTDTLFFRLNLDTETLHWTIEEVSDAAPYQS